MEPKAVVVYMLVAFSIANNNWYTLVATAQGISYYEWLPGHSGIKLNLNSALEGLHMHVVSILLTLPPGHRALLHNRTASYTYRFYKIYMYAST